MKVLKACCHQYPAEITQQVLGTCHVNFSQVRNAVIILLRWIHTFRNIILILCAHAQASRVHKHTCTCT